MKLFIDKELSPVSTCADGRTVLHHLVTITHNWTTTDLECLSLLINYGCPIYAVDNMGKSLLHVILDSSSHFNCKEPLQQILGDGRMVSCESKNGVLPVQLAIRNYQPPATIKLLLPDHVSTWNSTKIRRKGLLHGVVELVHLPHPPRPVTLGLPFTSPKQEINQESPHCALWT